MGNGNERFNQRTSGGGKGGAKRVEDKPFEDGLGGGTTPQEEKFDRGA